MLSWRLSFEYSLELPHQNDSNKYTQHTIIYRRLNSTLSPIYLLFVSGSNYPCLEQISKVPKMFEPLKFDCFWHSTVHTSLMSDAR